MLHIMEIIIIRVLFSCVKAALYIFITLLLENFAKWKKDSDFRGQWVWQPKFDMKFSSVWYTSTLIPNFVFLAF